MAAHNELGKWGEDLASDYLEQKCYTIMERDWKSGRRDIDIIAHDGNTIVFVEVKTRVEKLIPVYEEALNNVKALDNQDAQDFLARRLYDMTAELVMSLLIIRDASKAPELFKKSANVYVRMTEEDVYGKSAYIKAFQVEDLEQFKAAEPEAEAEA